MTWSRRPSAENSLQILSIGDLVHINDPRFLIAKKPQDNVSVEDPMLIFKTFKASLHFLHRGLWCKDLSLLPWSDVRNNCITSMHTLLFMARRGREQNIGIVFSRSGGQGREQLSPWKLENIYILCRYKYFAGLGAAGGGGAAVRQRAVPVPGHLPPTLLHSRHRLRSGWVSTS